MRCRCAEWIGIKAEGWLGSHYSKVQVRAFALGRSIIVLINDQGTFLGRNVNNCTLCT